MKDWLSLACSLTLLAAVCAIFAARGELWRFLEETFMVSVLGWDIVGGIVVHIGLTIREKLAERWPRLARIGIARVWVGLVGFAICAYLWVAGSLACTFNHGLPACPDYHL